MDTHREVSTVFSRAPAGLDAPMVRVEVHLGAGLPAFNLVGLPEAVVRESKERVRAALVTAGYDFPHRRITASVAALIGGGALRPGELSLAHLGVLFLDE